MREYRSGSQILFGHLPDQTVDADGRIWKVKRWNDPRVESAIDVSALREELIRAAYPWKERQQDGGFVDDLYAQRSVRVRSLNNEEGVWCEPFPRLYLCQACRRLHDEPMGRCQCGSTRSRGQLPFVGFHDLCGAIKTPYVAKCRTHGQRAVRFPGTASAAELVFYCPVCNAFIQRGFGAACDCDQGGTLSFTVHRSGAVFKPRGISMINPPRREILNTIEQAGGGERALQWVLDGMKGSRVTESAPTRSPESVRKMLEDRGFDAATIDAMLAAMAPAEGMGESQSLVLDPQLRTDAERQAKQIALATYESRLTLSDLHGRAQNTALRNLYEHEYPRALARAGLERVELIDRFPVLTAQFGYTRGPATPGDSRLRTYRDSNGDYSIYGELIQTEALLFRLRPEMIQRWLIDSGEQMTPAAQSIDAAQSILGAMAPIDRPNEVTKKVTELVHSFSHALIKRAAVYAGIERSALSELILPTAFSFFVYATARGSFVLGGLQALFESELHMLLDALVDDEHRCALDPGCEDTGAACAVCLHLGEPSCSMFNTALSRKALAGGHGFFDVTSASEAS
ncbi:Uncharacterised protein [Burkholderia pseudomallei]|uniref:DUF1998 domain-containing protein n=1 Tax=Burkholderia pseudomallei TaxID=28450 RepID=UPI000420D946|nr:DUF1998 domain-containing protein [Burkholderia pseudomallei]AIP50384.1 hypothetical protein DR55_522 [Burkholderia pseudomallei HBPUB10134a]MBF3754672.1 DUF1998 domain-containing protein [Burkholderia pseudomallei]MBO7797163.1 DUF1998 domain-containing protein [Burkholderia pseudomallei]MBO7815348.1 DUF1998 domain-containing protein [Burkholderia pseudomallei]CAJ4527154.1 Uncharacterised protein [Burkholderia pseudomallei]